MELPTLDDIDKELAQRSLSEYIRQAWHIVEPGNRYVPGWHIDAICEHLEAATRGEIRNLIINIPPRHMKSLITCVFWPTWLWTSRPETRWLFSSYGENLSIRDSIKCRRIIQSNWYQKNWGDTFQLTGDQNSKTRFENDKTGYRLATGVGGLGTGDGGDFLVCLPAEQVITTRQGDLPIGEIVEQKISVEVLTYNHEKGCTEWQPIERYERNEGRALVEIDVGDQVIRCTEDHPVYVEGKGYVKAIDLVEGDVVLYCPNPMV